MAEEGFKRKLTAILSADVVGYSRLMRDNEEATVRDIAANRVLITETIQQHHGRVVDSPGDNILAEFASVVDAVNGAIKIQDETKKINTDIPEDRQMAFRIGINLGDVIEEKGRIYGDGVNIAARVEGLAAGGGIAISGTVYEHIKEKLSLGYHYLGEQNVKNISEPVRVYRILTEPADAGKMIGEKQPKSKKLKWAASGAIALIVLIVGIAIWNYHVRPSFEPASVEKMAYPLPDKPSIAVLAFENLSGDPSQEYFSDGITEDIITALSKTPKMFVIASNSTFTYKGKPVKIKQVAEELVVRYILKGSVQRTGNRVRITAQLIDALNGHDLWAEKYDRDLKDIFSLQDEITKEIITALQVNLTEGEQAAIRAKGTNNLEAYLKTLEARELVMRWNIEDNYKARQLYNEALKLDPNYAITYCGLAITHIMDLWLGSTKSKKDSIAKATELIKKALSLDNYSGQAFRLLGNIYYFENQYDEGILELEKAVELVPNGADGFAQLARGLDLVGRTEEAIQMSDKAMRLNPIPPDWYIVTRTAMYRNNQNYEEALKWAKKAVERAPNNFFAHINLCSVYSLLGQMEKARLEAEEAMKLNPKFSLRKYEKTIPYKIPLVKQRYIGALRKAGVPD